LREGAIAGFLKEAAVQYCLAGYCLAGYCLVELHLAELYRVEPHLAARELVVALVTALGSVAVEPRLLAEEPMEQAQAQYLEAPESPQSIHRREEGESEWYGNSQALPDYGSLQFLQVDPKIGL
jgi:hypothetical protein